jgi:hypothetical protein
MTTTTVPTYTFDGACEAVRSVLTKREADALIDCALLQKDDPRSAASLAVEFGLDTMLGRQVAAAVVDGVQN